MESANQAKAWLADFLYLCGKTTAMKKEIDPKESPRGRAFELWKTAGMPKVTIVKTFDVSRLVRVAKRSGMKTNMLMCWCIGQAASGIQEFYTLPAGGHLWLYDRLAVMTVVKTMNGDARLCDIPFSADLRQFNEDYFALDAPGQRNKRRPPSWRRLYGYRHLGFGRMRD